MKNIQDIKRDQKVMRANMRKQGFVFGHDSDALGILRSAFFHVASALGDVLKPVPIAVLAVYDVDEQKAVEAKISDAICYFCTNGNRKIFGLCVSYQGIRHGRDYLYFLILHELAHAIVTMHKEPDKQEMGHDELFEATLNELLSAFNDATGSKLKNDYLCYGEE